MRRFGFLFVRNAALTRSVPQNQISE